MLSKTILLQFTFFISLKKTSCKSFIYAKSILFCSFTFFKLIVAGLFERKKRRFFVVFCMFPNLQLSANCVKKAGTYAIVHFLFIKHLELCRVFSFELRHVLEENQKYMCSLKWSLFMFLRYWKARNAVIALLGRAKNMPVWKNLPSVPMGL